MDRNQFRFDYGKIGPYKWLLDHIRSAFAMQREQWIRPCEGGRPYGGRTPAYGQHR